MRLCEAYCIMVRGSTKYLLAASALLKADSRYSLSVSISDWIIMRVVHNGLARLVVGLLGIVRHLVIPQTSRHASGKAVRFGMDIVSGLRVGTSRDLDALRSCGQVSMSMAVVVWHAGVDGHTIKDAAWGPIGGDLWDRLSVRCGE